MPSRRDILQGCLLAGISLTLPRMASAGSVGWTARWRIDDDEGDRKQVFLTVSPDRDTTLKVQFQGDTPVSGSPGSLTYTVSGSDTVHQGSDVQRFLSRVGPRFADLKLARGADHTFGPWIVHASATQDLHLKATIHYADDQTAILEHRTGKPQFEVAWETAPVGRSTVSVRLAVTADRDTNIHLVNGAPQGFSVRSGGSLVQPPDARMSRAGPRRHAFPLVAGSSTKLGGWLVSPDADTLTVALDLEHDGGITHFEATLPVERTGA